MKRTSTPRRDLTTAALCLCSLLGFGLQQAQAGKATDDRFKLYFQTAYWSGDYDVRQVGFEAENASIIVYSSHLFRFQDEFQKGPDVFDHDEYMLAFVDAVNRDVPAGYSGLVMIDYEAFPTSLYDPHRHPFIDPRVDAILDDSQYNGDGNMTRDEATEIAQSLYHPYAEAFYSSTLAKLREMRPQAKVGFYSIVSMDGMKGIEPRDVKANDHAQWLYDQVDVLAPYAYLWGPPHDQTLPSNYSEKGVLTDWTGEWVRLRDNVERRTGKRPLLLPYIAVSYGGHCDESKILSTEQLTRYYKIVKAAGADGAIQWLSVRDDTPLQISEDEYIEFMEGPMQEAFRDSEGIESPGGGSSGKGIGRGKGKGKNKSRITKKGKGKNKSRITKKGKGQGKGKGRIAQSRKGSKRTVKKSNSSGTGRRVTKKSSTSSRQKKRTSSSGSRYKKKRSKTAEAEAETADESEKSDDGDKSSDGG